MAGAKPTFGYWGSSSEELLKSQFPLHCACRDGEVEKLALLLREAQHGIYAEDSFYGWTPAHWAAYFGKLGCLRKLMSNTGVGADCDVRSSRFNQTPTHMAAFGGHPHCLQWLLQSRADMNTKDYLGETPLHKAARTGSMECCSLLASHGADVEIRNYNGLTPSELAKSCNYAECSRYLEGATVTAEETQLRGINHELLPATLPQEQPAKHQNGHMTNAAPGQMNRSEDNDCEMEMESEESHNSATNGFSTSMNGFSGGVTGLGVQSAVNGSSNGFSNGHLNGHYNGVQNGFGNGHIDDVLLNTGVSLVGGKKRLREADDAGKIKRMRTGDDQKHVLCGPLRVMSTDSVSSQGIMSAPDTDSTLQVDHMMCESSAGVEEDSLYADVLSLSTEPLRLNDKTVSYAQDENFNQTHYWPIFF